MALQCLNAHVLLANALKPRMVNNLNRLVERALRPGSVGLLHSRHDSLMKRLNASAFVMFRAMRPGTCVLRRSLCRSAIGLLATPLVFDCCLDNKWYDKAPSLLRARVLLV